MNVYLTDTRCLTDSKLFSSIYNTLSPVRRKKIDAFTNDADKRLSMGAGYLLERGLKALDAPSRLVHIEYGRDGKPTVDDPDIHFNLSHSGVYAVCAISESEVGVDVQQLSEKLSDGMLRVACTQKEREYLEALDEEKKRSEFYRLWTIKESFMKYLGTGMSLSPSRVEVEFKNRIAVFLDGKKQKARFQEYELDGYMLTVCSGKSDFAPTVTEVKLDCESI